MGGGEEEDAERAKRRKERGLERREKRGRKGERREGERGGCREGRQGRGKECMKGGNRVRNETNEVKKITGKQGHEHGWICNKAVSIFIQD